MEGRERPADVFRRQPPAWEFPYPYSASSRVMNAWLPVCRSMTRTTMGCPSAIMTGMDLEDAPFARTCPAFPENCRTASFSLR